MTSILVISLSITKSEENIYEFQYQEKIMKLIVLKLLITKQIH